MLHEDTPHRHIHMAVRTLGGAGEHLNPKRGDYDRWRELFAEALRDQGLEAQATRRAARGVTLKGERHRLRKIRELYEQGRGPRPATLTAAYGDAAAALLGERDAPLDWETLLRRRRDEITKSYVAQAHALERSPDPEDRALGREIRAFVAAMPDVETRRLRLARELQTAYVEKMARDARAQARERVRDRERDR